MDLCERTCTNVPPATRAGQPEQTRARKPVPLEKPSSGKPKNSGVCEVLSALQLSVLMKSGHGETRCSPGGARSTLELQDFSVESFKITF